MKQIIMTSPTSFAVHYVINPHMEGNEGAIDITKAVQQWSNLRNALIGASVDVIVMPQPPTYCPDAVFTANAGLIYQNKFLPSRFRYEERQAEETYFIDWYLKHCFNILSDVEIEEPREFNSFEGAGDALFDKSKGILWYGFGFRSSLTYKSTLDREFDETDMIVRPLGLVDPRWYHLDTCFCPLDNGGCLWYPGAFDEHAQYTIETWYGDSAIAVSEEDALGFACNAVSVGSTVITPTISEDLLYTLNERGYAVVQVEMSEFLKSGGACKCLTLEVIE